MLERERGFLAWGSFRSILLDASERTTSRIRIPAHANIIRNRRIQFNGEHSSVGPDTHNCCEQMS